MPLTLGLVVSGDRFLFRSLFDLGVLDLLRPPDFDLFLECDRDLDRFLIGLLVLRRLIGLLVLRLLIGERFLDRDLDLRFLDRDLDFFRDRDFDLFLDLDPGFLFGARP